jgi:hypothetical protein
LSRGVPTRARKGIEDPVFEVWLLIVRTSPRRCITSKRQPAGLFPLRMNVAGSRGRKSALRKTTTLCDAAQIR